MLGNLAGLGRVLGSGAVLLTAGCNVFGPDGARVQVVVTRDGGAIPASAVIPDSTGASADRGDDDRALGLWRFQTATVTLSSIVARTSDGELVGCHV